MGHMLDAGYHDWKDNPAPDEFPGNWPGTSQGNKPGDGSISFKTAEGALFHYPCTGKIHDSDAPPDVKQILIGMFMEFGADSPNLRPL